MILPSWDSTPAGVLLTWPYRAPDQSAQGEVFRCGGIGGCGALVLRDDVMGHTRFHRIINKLDKEGHTHPTIGGW